MTAGDAAFLRLSAESSDPSLMGGFVPRSTNRTWEAAAARWFETSNGVWTYLSAQIAARRNPRTRLLRRMRDHRRVSLWESDGKSSPVPDQAVTVEAAAIISATPPFSWGDL